MSMHEMLGRKVLESDTAVKPRPPENPRGIISSEQEETAEFFRNPPKAILIPDCYIPQNPQLAEAFMCVRRSLAAKVYHSLSYETVEERPIVMSFANVHAPGESSGSEKVAGLITDQEVPPEKLIALKTTITGSGDVSQFHAIAKTKSLHLKGRPLAIAVDDDYAQRARQDTINHERAHKNFYATRVYILHPSHMIIDQLTFSSDLNNDVREEIARDIALGRSGKLKHGLMEKGAWALSATPIIRPLFQQRTEEITHEDMRHKEQSRYIAKRMKIAAGKLWSYRQLLVAAGHPYKSKEKGKKEPDKDSAMALAPGLFTRTADRGGPNDKEANIQALVAKLPKLPDMPAHG